MELMPPAVLFIVYEKTGGSRSKARQVAAVFSEELGLSLKPLNIPSIDIGNMTVYVYYFSGPVSKAREAMAGRLRGYGDGLAEQTYSLYSQGVFIPGAAPRSANGSMFITSVVTPLALNLAQVSIPGFKGLMEATCLAGYWLDAVHSPSDLHVFNPLKILGLNKARFTKRPAISLAVSMVILPRREKRQSPSDRL